MVASKKSKRTTTQRIIAREDFVKCAVGNIQLHPMAMSERKLTIINTGVTVRQVRREKMVAACASLNTGMDLINICVVRVKLRHGDSGDTLKTYVLLDSCSQGIFF